MLYPSPIRLTLAPGTAHETRLVDWDDPISAIPQTGQSQATAVADFLGAEWAGLDALGDATRQLEVEASLSYPSAAAAAQAMLDGQTAALQWLRGARVELANPLVSPGLPDSLRRLVRWDIADAAVQNFSAGLDVDGRVRQRFSLVLGESAAEIMPEPPSVDGILTVTASLVRHDGQSWLRLTCVMPAEFTGSASDGWVDTAAARRIDLQHSFDLMSWSLGKFIQAPGIADVIADGERTTWADCIYPQDCEQLVSDQRIWWQRPDGSNITAWTYAQSLTALCISGEYISLPHFPYAIPGCATQLQADLRAAGYAGAVVSDDPEAERFEIFLYDIPTTNYDHVPGGVVYPGFQYRNTFGDLLWSGTMWSVYLNPRFGPGLDPFDVYMRQFARGKVTRI